MGHLAHPWVYTTLAFVLHIISKYNFKNEKYKLAAILLLMGEVANSQDQDKKRSMFMKDYDYVTDVISYIGFVWVALLCNLRLKTKFWLIIIMLGLFVKSKMKTNTFIIYCAFLSSFMYNVEHINNNW